MITLLRRLFVTCLGIALSSQLMLGCSIGSVASTPIPSSPTSAQSVAPTLIQGSPTSSQSPPTAVPSADIAGGSPGAPVDPAVQAILDDPNRNLTLEALPANHIATISVEEAEATTLAELNLDGPILYVAHGMGHVSSDLSKPVWLVIAKVQEMTPFPVGPACPSPSEDCVSHWAVNDYAGALISDESGELLRSFATLRDVPAPSGVPE